MIILVTINIAPNVSNKKIIPYGAGQEPNSTLRGPNLLTLIKLTIATIKVKTKPINVTARFNG